MDTRDTRLQNLIFLLSAAPLSVGCIITDDGDTDTEAATSETPTTETPATTTEAVTDGATDAMTTGATTSDDRGETTETPADTTVGPADTTTGGVEIPPVCATYGDAIEACFAGYGEGAASDCAYQIASYEMYGASAECITAFEDWIACLSALTCKELEMPPGTVCVDEEAAIDTACVPK